MPIPPHSHESHRINNIGWLRAAVLGANDGILSIASILSGVAAFHAGHGFIVLSGLAATVAGAASMGAGEYISVSSQGDILKADLAREQAELLRNPVYERDELKQIYIGRGVEPALAEQVANQLMRRDALGAHARDEMGVSDLTVANPFTAALASSASFALGAALPLLVAALVSGPEAQFMIFATSLVSLALLGFIGARVARTPALRPVLRTLLWGALSMGLTSLIGLWFPASK